MRLFAAAQCCLASTSLLFVREFAGRFVLSFRFVSTVAPLKTTRLRIFNLLLYLSTCIEKSDSNRSVYYNGRFYNRSPPRMGVE